MVPHLTRPALREALTKLFGDGAKWVEHGNADAAPDWLLEQWVAGNRGLIIIGDSHSYPYYQLDRFTAYAGPLEAWIFCAGATARGLAIEQSNLGYGKKN